MSSRRTTAFLIWEVPLAVLNNAPIQLDNTTILDTNNNKIISVVATTTIKIMVLLVKVTRTTAATRTNILEA
jgi:hypothetical protein